MEYLAQFVVAAGLFVVIDSIWIAKVANKFYKDNLGHLLAPKPNFVPAAIFYTLYIIGIIVFALQPALDENSLSMAAVYGGFLGLVMYATYDLTNHATLKKWPAKVSVVDMLWGTILTGAITTLSFLIFQ